MLSEDLIKISELKSQVDVFRPIPNETMAKIKQKFRLDWNYHSNAIEGNSLTFGETKTFLLHGNTASGKPLKDHLEIQGHNEAILELEEIVKGNVQLTEHRIRSFHQLILREPYTIKAITLDGLETTKQIIPGKYKTQPNHVLTATGERFYFTEPNLVPIEMENLLDWFEKNQNNDDIHPLILSATFHDTFIRIHPFDDGNGRMARILMNLILMMKGYPPVIIKTEDKENYYRALRQADGGDLNSFIEYIGKQLIHSLELMIRGAKGESIEDDDDIDKRLKLLLGQISEEKRNSVKVKRNSNLVYLAMKETFIPFIDSLINKYLFKMKDFFLDISCEISSNVNNSQTYTFKNIDLYKKEIEEFYKENKDKHPTNITININLKGFKHDAKGVNLTLKSYVYFNFQEYNFTISTSHPEISELTLLYDNQVSTKIIEGFAKSLANHWTSRLEEYVTGIISI